MRLTLTYRALGIGVLIAIFTGPTGSCAQPASPSESPYLFIWAGDADEQDSDFLAVVDARRSEPTYGRIVTTLPVGATGTMPHHMQYEYPPDHLLFANGWVAGRTFIIDVHDPLSPLLTAQFTDAGEYSFPHSFARLPNGHEVATFQGRNGRYDPPGGLVELDSQGRELQAASAATPDVPDSLNWPYSLMVVPEKNRAVSTSADMGMPPWDEYKFHNTHHVQVWSLNPLQLLATIPLPEVEQGAYHIAPAEPRMLSDGSVYVSTFSCGLYRLDGLESENPTATFLHSFPGGALGEECFVPVVYGDYWIQPVPALPGLIVLDVADSRNPKEVFRLKLDERYRMPHWLAADRKSGRLVLTGDGGSWVLIMKLDEETGALSVDERFRDEGAEYPGVDFDRSEWPHGETGKAIVHGALFMK